MKRKKLKSLKLHKKTISNFNDSALMGGLSGASCDTGCTIPSNNNDPLTIETICHSGRSKCTSLRYNC